MMERVVDITMTRLFRLAEHVLAKCTFLSRGTSPAVPQKSGSTIHFTDEDKAAQTKATVVEGELFK